MLASNAVRSLLATTLCFGLAGLWAPRPANADVFGTQGERVPKVARVEALLVEDPEGAYLIESLYLPSAGAQTVWLRPVPGAPEMRPGPDVFETLIEGAVPTPPHAASIRSRPFGPSVVTLLAERLNPTPAPPNPRPLPESRPLEVDQLEIFRGSVETSTMTGSVSLPADLEIFLRRRGVTVREGGRRKLATYLNRGWSVIAASIYDPSPTNPVLGRIGPFRTQWSGEVPGYPILRRRSGAELLFGVIASEAKVAEKLGVVQGDQKPPREGASELLFAGAVLPGTPLEAALTELELVNALAPAVYTRFALRPGEAELDLVRFGPGAAALGAPEIPLAAPAGSPSDLLLCLLLGLAPLALAPESWLVLWLQGRARDSARGGGSRLGVKLWAAWSLLVAAYWFFSLVGLARVAALGPLIIGTAQLAVPFAERTPSRFRAELPRRRVKSTTDVDPEGA